MIQKRHSCQLAPEKEGQRLKREQGKSDFGAEEAISKFDIISIYCVSPMQCVAISLIH